MIAQPLALLLKCVDPDDTSRREELFSRLCRIDPIAALNVSHYCNQDVDRELNAAREVEARTERVGHYRKVADHTLKDLPLIYLYHPKFLYAATAKLSGFTPYPDGLIRPQGLRME